MTLEQMNAQIATLKADFKNAESAVRRRFAIENQKYQIGDILVHNNTQIGRVVAVKCGVYGDPPQMVYEVTLLTKDLKPRKVKRGNEPVKFWQEYVTGKINE